MIRGFLQKKLPTCGRLWKPGGCWNWDWKSMDTSILHTSYTYVWFSNRPLPGELAVFTVVTTVVPCGASAYTVCFSFSFFVLFFSSLHRAGHSLERELCYSPRKSGYSSVMWFEEKSSYIFYFSFSEITSICYFKNLWVDIQVCPSLRKLELFNYKLNTEATLRWDYFHYRMIS